MFVDDPKHINQKKFFLSTPKIILAGIKAIREKRGHYCKRNAFYYYTYVGNNKLKNFCTFYNYLAKCLQIDRLK